MSSTHTSDALSSIDSPLLEGLKGDTIVVDTTAIQAPPSSSPPSSSTMVSNTSLLSNAVRRRFASYWSHMAHPNPQHIFTNSMGRV